MMSARVYDVGAFCSTVYSFGQFGPKPRPLLPGTGSPNAAGHSTRCAAFMPARNASSRLSSAGPSAG